MLDLWSRSHTNPEHKNERKPFKWILVDSAVIGCISVFASAPNLIPTLNEGWVMLKAFGGAFFIQLAIERGIKRGK